MEQTPDQNKIEQAPQAEVKMEEGEQSRVSKFLLSIGIDGKHSVIVLSLVFSVVIFSSFVSFLSMPPFGFPKDKMILVKKGASLTEVSTLLDKENLIRSQSFFELCSKFVGGPKPISAGQYLFREPVSSCTIAFRIAHNISGVPAIKVTIPEGMSNEDVSKILQRYIPGFDAAFFLEHARSQEGFLFPDTYLFPENVTAQGVETIMNDNFNAKIEPWRGVIETSKHPLRDIVIMASILEKEATTDDDKALVSGVLWNRISKGMPLQVDASFMYLLSKKSSELTASDLQLKSGYNTYKNKGLPGGPLGNPGMMAISAAIHPTESSYLYYLSDKNGVMHYAKTFQEHIANKAKYLR